MGINICAQMFTLRLLLIWCSVSVQFSTTEEVHVDHREFVWKILDKYGQRQNNSLTVEGFERLYKNLGLGTMLPEVKNLNSSTNSSTLQEFLISRNTRDIQPNNTSKSQEELARLMVQHNEVPQLPYNYSSHHLLNRCLSVQEMLVVYELPPSNKINMVSLMHLCPAILYQLDQGVCVRSLGKEPFTTTASADKSWMYAFLSWLVISVSGMMIVTLVPLLQKTLLNQLIAFLVALAVGTLLGDAFLHLIPHALMENSSQGNEGENDNHTRENHNHTSSVKKTGLMFLTVVFFFIFESVLNKIRSKKGDHKVQETTYVSVSVNENEKEMMELDKAPKPVHSHSHSYGNGTGNHSNTALMVVMGDGLHNLTDGLAIGAAFTGGLAPGFATAVAVFTHELPHELGDFAVLLQSGVSVRKALFFNVVSSALSLLGTVIGLLIGNFGDTTKYVYAITAGCFTYIALSNLVPEITRHSSAWNVIVLRLCGVLSGGSLMASIAVYEHDLQNMFQ